jgi:hypothetical protein
MPQAGLLAQRDLIALLAPHGYTMSNTTPCLFTNPNTHVSFVLWVDDFLLKYKKTAKHEVDALFAILRTKYELKVDWSGRRYLGLTIQRNQTRKTLTISMPGYIQRLFHKLCIPIPTSPAHSPITPLPRTYGASSHLEPLESPPLPPAVAIPTTKTLQQVIGVLLFYGLMVDYTIIQAVNRLAAQQLTPTETTGRDLLRLLAYVATYPDAKLVFYKSNMQLTIHSDASYASEPHSRSRAGGVFILGNANFQGVDSIHAPPINGAVAIVSKTIKSVCSSVAEAEYIAQFMNAHSLGITIRQTLADLGHPQLHPTPIIYDNEVSGKIAQQTCKMRRSKSIAMRYHWLRDRVASGEFSMEWRPGKHNLADFFTKIPSVTHHKQMSPFFIDHSSSQVHV